ncbi:unnamed protein product [Oppiella nova]|uniref:Uncharacterized protein n=1 Tax=Oppiella nova TaxID=334625 RepID=A0A7R9QXK6_9ACAR|nr:unnamed protein product [Oppiella nova]CAG2178607.1 unnamed protein product [Oppiella nova]
MLSERRTPDRPTINRQHRICTDTALDNHKMLPGFIMAFAIILASSSLSSAYTTETYGTGNYNYYNSRQTRRWGGTGTPNGYYGVTGQLGTGRSQRRGILTTRMALVARVMGVILAPTVCTALVGPTQGDSTKELLVIIK